MDGGNQSGWIFRKDRMEDEGIKPRCLIRDRESRNGIEGIGEDNYTCR